MMILRSLPILFKPPTPVPDEYRSNFRQLYWDITWFGLLNGSAMSFISVYAARLGADGLQIGLLTAAPAIVVLSLALPAGNWLQSRRLGRSVLWAAAVNRAFYLVWAIFPWLIPAQLEIWGIILAILIMSIPATIVAVGFNALFADAVPPEWRGYVVGIRNAAFALTSTVTTIFCGWLLDTLPFPGGYQVVFVIGFVGGMMSCLYLARVRPICQAEKQKDPGNSCPIVDCQREAIDDPCLPPQKKPRLVTRVFQPGVLRLDILAGSYGRTVGLLFFFHLAQYLAIPIIPLFLVNQLSMTDPEIGLGNAIFYTLVFLGSTQLGRFSSQWGHKAVTGYGILLLAMYPGFIALSRGFSLYLVASIVGGFAWSMTGGALYNYLLEKVPATDRPPYLAWYNLGLHAAVLVGSLAGPVFASQVGLVTALLSFMVLRFIAGLAIIRFG